AGGKLFQSWGAAEQKALSPLVLSLVEGTERSRPLDDLFGFILKKQHSLWVQGDVYRSKQKLTQQRFNRQQQHRQLPNLPSSDLVIQGKQEAMSHLVSSMDDLSIKTTLCKSYSLDESNCKETSLTQGDNLRALKGKRTPWSASSSSRLNTSKASHCSIIPPPKLPKITLSLPQSSSKKLIQGSSTVTQIKSPFRLSLFNTRPALIH
ncbi:hypothetical protein AMECASPLE_028186, partial [Ameca splendens]